MNALVPVMLFVSVIIQAIIIDAYAASVAEGVVSRSRRRAVSHVPCLSHGKYYRDPEHKDHDSVLNCAKYYLCMGGQVFEFKCSSGLLFDIQRQICDFKFNVDNCQVAIESTTPNALLVTDEPLCNSGELACADKTCFPRSRFCDDHVDCADGSDEGHCDLDHDPNAAPRCNPANCTLPDCFCSSDGTQIPGGLSPDQVPQMILLTFDDAVNYQNWDLYEEIFTVNRTNPNGCPIRATFYLSHEYTNYQYVQKLWNGGHEIAVHSITHRQPERWWSSNATLDDWFDEFVGQANIINRFAGVAMDDLRGMRVPFLRVGGNRQFNMMKEFGFVYDSTMVAPPSDPPLWPYTLDYRMPHKCVGAEQKCPSQSHEGVWEMIMNQLNANEYSCAMVDSCPGLTSEEEVYELLNENLKRHFNTNRAPFGLYFHTSWFNDKQNLKGFLRFLNDMLNKPEVWFVTNHQAIEWMRDPLSLSEVTSLSEWNCDRQVAPEDRACNVAKACQLSNRQVAGDRYLHTCYDCPGTYPWIKNEFGMET